MQIGRTLLKWLDPSLYEHVSRMEKLHEVTKNHIRYIITPVEEPNHG